MPTAAFNPECQVRTQVVRMIEQARTDAAGPGHQQTALRLASETIRLARLAASTHMVLEARRLHAETRQAGGSP
ncbi:MAG: hypothetical protein ACYS0D_10530 [Planctomycetota bacterium]|jgi:hypothetical protein